MYGVCFSREKESAKRTMKEGFVCFPKNHEWHIEAGSSSPMWQKFEHKVKDTCARYHFLHNLDGRTSLIPMIVINTGTENIHSHPIGFHIYESLSDFIT
jgi:hypothetical protein